jgi:molybdopterin synthase catalytic subunit
MTLSINCRIQTEDFSVTTEYQALQRPDCGAVVIFSGLVREHFAPIAPLSCENTLAGVDRLLALELEHYPGMTERSIIAIAQQAAARYDLRAVTIIHRIGVLPVHEQIVLVGIASPHRRDAFAACEMLMDYLKNEVPLWKKAHFQQSSAWVEAKASDKTALARWEQRPS